MHLPCVVSGMSNTVASRLYTIECDKSAKRAAAELAVPDPTPEVAEATILECALPAQVGPSGDATVFNLAEREARAHDD